MWDLISSWKMTSLGWPCISIIISVLKPIYYPIIFNNYLIEKQFQPLNTINSYNPINFFYVILRLFKSFFCQRSFQDRQNYQGLPGTDRTPILGRWSENHPPFYWYSNVLSHFSLVHNIKSTLNCYARDRGFAHSKCYELDNFQKMS